MIDGNVSEKVPAKEVVEFEKEVVNLINKEREARGLKPLKVSSGLQAAAGVRAAEIIYSFDHTRLNGESCFTEYYGMSGENIAAWQWSPEMVMQSWMNSDGHRANILNASFTKVGVGCMQTDSGSNYWVQCFGR